MGVWVISTHSYRSEKRVNFELNYWIKTLTQNDLIQIKPEIQSNPAETISPLHLANKQYYKKIKLTFISKIRKALGRWQEWVHFLSMLTIICHCQFSGSKDKREKQKTKAKKAAKVGHETTHLQRLFQSISDRISVTSTVYIRAIYLHLSVWGYKTPSEDLLLS